MNENVKRELIGVVVSDKADKTITVKVETYKKSHYKNWFKKFKIYWKPLKTNNFDIKFVHMFCG